MIFDNLLRDFGPRSLSHERGGRCAVKPRGPRGICFTENIRSDVMVARGLRNRPVSMTIAILRDAALPKSSRIALSGCSPNRVSFENVDGKVAKDPTTHERFLSCVIWNAFPSTRPPRGCAREGVERVTHGSLAPASGWPLPRQRSAMICGPDEAKTPRNGVEKAVFSKIGYVVHNSATPFSGYN